MTDDCLFCKIAAGQLGTELLVNTDDYVVFKDIKPKARIHLLVVPKIHITSLNDLTETHRQLIANMMLALPQIAKDHGVKGFRTIINTGPEGGQEVPHLHIHLLAGNNLPGFK